jgi:septal ring factor EnvC (AmiA/AmiB activator)
MRTLVLFFWLCATALNAQGTPAESAQAALAQLEDASRALTAADGARDRVAALTQTVQAYESGLAALRSGMRAAAIREESLSQSLFDQRDEIARLLGVLQTMERAPAPLLLLHPTGPTGTARSGMILADVTPALQAKADTLRLDLEEVTLLRELQASAVTTLETGLAGVQQARAALTLAMSERRDLPQRYSEDPLQIALLIASAETLDGFATGLASVGGPASIPLDEVIPGNLPSPVPGLVLHHAGEADAAGITRPGTLIATRPRALVTTPTAATLRYTGPLLDYGTVVILEPAPDHLLVLAGLAQAFGTTGQILPAGSPVGLMGGAIGDVDAILTANAQGSGPMRSETLYIELRNGQGPIDPATWFALDEE